MERNDKVKVVYEDNSISKVVRGTITDYDEFTITLQCLGTLDKLVIGKRAIVKIQGDLQ